MYEPRLTNGLLLNLFNLPPHGDSKGFPSLIDTWRKPVIHGAILCLLGRRGTSIRMMTNLFQIISSTIRLTNNEQVYKNAPLFSHRTIQIPQLVDFVIGTLCRKRLPSIVKSCPPSKVSAPLPT
jgi:hypothetical protein